MRAEIEDFKTGWFGLTIGIKKDEIDQLISALNNLKKSDGHFHLRSDFNGSGGVGDIELYMQNTQEESNLELDTTPAIYTED